VDAVADHLSAFHFAVEMKAIAKPRMTRADAWRDPPRPAVRKYREFVDAMRAAIIDAKRTFGVGDEWTMEGNVLVEVAFFSDATVVRVKQQPGKLRGKRAGDIDNLAKSVLESLQTFQGVPILIDDDSQVATLFAQVVDDQRA